MAALQRPAKLETKSGKIEAWAALQIDKNIGKIKRRRAGS